MHELPISYYPTANNYFCVSTTTGANNFINEIMPYVNYNITHIGKKESPNILGAIDMRGVSFYQENYIIKNSLGVISSDEYYRYLCKYLSVPFYKIDNDNKPEILLDILGDRSIKIKTKYVGKRFIEKIIDIVPDHYVHKEILKRSNIVYRFDIKENYDWVLKNQTNNPTFLRSDSPLDVKFLNNHRNINVLYYFYNQPNYDFINDMVKRNINHIIMTPDTNPNLTHIKYSLLDITENFMEAKIPTKNDLLRLNVSESDLFKSNKLIVSEGILYPSRAHLEYKIKNQTENFLHVCFHDPQFWEDAEHYLIYSATIPTQHTPQSSYPTLA